MLPNDNPTIKIRTMRRRELLAKFNVSDYTLNRMLKRDRRPEVIKLWEETKNKQVLFPDQVRRLLAAIGPWEAEYKEP